MQSLFLLCITAGIFFPIFSRSPHRPENCFDPILITRWENETKTYSIKDIHLTYNAYFTLYNKNLEKHYLPKGPISFRNDPSKTITSEKLSQYIEELLAEVQSGKRKYKHFKPLKQSDFDVKKHSGLVIAKLNDLPFVVKLSIETPASLVKPEGKGFQPDCFFLMAGGVNRHLTGFTRIPNCEYLQKQVQKSPIWATRVSFPRKWYWLPKNHRNIIISCKNLGHDKESIAIPATYAIISDFIEAERPLELSCKSDRALAMSLTDYLQLNVDPHINNFIIEKNTRKIVALDTEHFPTLVGFTEDDAPPCKSYFHWYLHLATKYLKSVMTKNKKERYPLLTKG